MIQAQHVGAVALIEVQGGLTAAMLPKLDSAIASGGRQASQVVMDLSHTSLLDSAALEWLLDTEERCRRQGGRMVLARPSPLCSEVLKLTGVTKRCLIYSDQAAAIGSFVL